MRAPGAGQDVFRGNGDRQRLRPGALFKQTVWLRTILSHVRRMLHRGQSFQSTGARGSGAGGSVRIGEIFKGEEESGHNTALTRRGLTQEELS